MRLIIKFSIFILLCVCWLWFLDLDRESKIGFVFVLLKDFFKYGFVLFVFREVMFFFSIFWFYFDRGLNQSYENFEAWLPSGLRFINPFTVPLINTFILLSSGFSVTVLHINLVNNKKDIIRCYFTVILGLLFLVFQIIEYKTIIFRFSDSVFGTIFFFGTGFHGLHVFIGVVFLRINFLRLIKLEFNIKSIISIEFSIIYWHFVDVVWLFLFCWVYWWIYLKIIL